MTSTQLTLGSRHSAKGNLCYHLWYHGLTCEQYEGLIARAAGHCEICGAAEGDSTRGHLVIDHFHGTGRGVSFIRGLICDKCNAGVMLCIDGQKAWGENRKYEAAAREYERNSWQQPSDEALRQMAARTEMLPVVRAPQRRWPRPAESWQQAPESVEVPLRKGQIAIARKLRRYLTPGQLARLAELLTEEG